MNRIKRLLPPANIGVVGGGQLGRMMALEAKRMGYHVIVLDPKPNAPAGQVADEQIEAEFNDARALKVLAEKSDVITYEFEHINVALLQKLEEEGYYIYPSSNTLGIIQNKLRQKEKLEAEGIPVPRFFKVNSLEQLTDIFNQLDRKIVLKTCSGGYDGKGNAIIKDQAKLADAYNEFSGRELMVEEFVPYVKEVSIIVARNDQEITFYPVAENNHQDSILISSIIPANISEEIDTKIRDIAKKVVEVLNDYGIFCIEFFVDAKGNVLVNEIAPRPHNSGHYSIEGCITSQYEQLVRVITGMPLGSVKLRRPCAMYNILGSDEVNGQYCIDGVHQVQSLEDCYFHLYGKSETKYLKKIGHITAMDDSTEAAEKKARLALDCIKIIDR